MKMIERHKAQISFSTFYLPPGYDPRADRLQLAARNVTSEVRGEISAVPADEGQSPGDGGDEQYHHD